MSKKYKLFKKSLLKSKVVKQMREQRERIDESVLERARDAVFKSGAMNETFDDAEPIIVSHNEDEIYDKRHAADVIAKVLEAKKDNPAFLKELLGLVRQH